MIKNVTDVNYNIPIFFSETGCIKPRPRDWADQEAIFGEEMIDNWSGSIVYEWIMEANEYGIVSYGPKVDPASPGELIQYAIYTRIQHADMEQCRSPS